MKLIKNTGADRVIDALRAALTSGCAIDLASPTFSLFAFGELHQALSSSASARVLLGSAAFDPHTLMGSASERPYRNRLSAFAHARRLAAWLDCQPSVKRTNKTLPQSFVAVGHSPASQVITGACPFVTDGLGLTPSEQFGLIQAAETPDECTELSKWFEDVWTSVQDDGDAKATLRAAIADIAAHKAPSLVYFMMLYHLFKDLGDELDEERIVKSATGIRDSIVWKKLFRFQRDGVIGAIDKLERYGGCIIADSVGLGKTFEALAVNRTKRLAIVDGIKYQRLGDEHYYAQELFQTEELVGYLKSTLKVQKASHDRIVYDSAGVERGFAEELEKNEAVKVYAKLPGWFKVPTPLGSYNPDWAVLIEKDGAERLYFVVETKGGLFKDDLRGKEGTKIECGKAHFEAIAVSQNQARFVVAAKLDDVLKQSD